MMSRLDFLTLTAVLADVALLALAVVFCARSTVHAANITVLDCGESDTDSFTLNSKTHRQFLKVMVRYRFLETVWASKRTTLDRNANEAGEEMLTIFQNTHASNRNNWQTQQPRETDRCLWKHNCNIGGYRPFWGCFQVFSVSGVAARIFSY